MSGLQYILCGSETWCLREKEMGILRTERAMVIAMREARLADRKNTEDMMDNYVGFESNPSSSRGGPFSTGPRTFEGPHFVSANRYCYLILLI